MSSRPRGGKRPLARATWSWPPWGRWCASDPAGRRAGDSWKMDLAGPRPPHPGLRWRHTRDFFTARPAPPRGSGLGGHMSLTPMAEPGLGSWISGSGRPFVFDEYGSVTKDPIAVEA